MTGAAAALLGLAGSPGQTALAAIVVVALLAPRLLPPIGRFLGRYVAAEMRRRLGMPARPTRGDRRTQDAPEPEVILPDAPSTTLRAGATSSLASRTGGAQRQPAADRPAPPWLALLVVSTATAVLLWYLLHPR